MSNREKPEGLKKAIRWEVFIPAYIVIGGAALLGIFNKDALTQGSNKFFFWSLDTFGWLYQIAVMASLALVAIVTCSSKFGKMRIGGKDAKPKYKFWTWFAMALTGGIATGIVTWGVNEPLIYFGNVWGELDKLGIKAFSPEAAVFSMGRNFYNWTFIPYAIYAMSGLLVAYVYYHKKESLTVTSTLKPLFGSRVTAKGFSAVIDTLSMLALIIGLITGLTMCITLVTSGLKGGYGIQESLPLFITLGVAIMLIFTFSSYIGMDKGLKTLSNLNAWFYYVLLLLLFLTGPTLYILRIGTAGMAEWLNNFFRWGLDPIDIGGEALTRSWTLFDWAFWVGYAPVTGIFLAMLAYGRTVREYMIVNWILPSVFGIIWFSIWGGSALDMQISGKADLVGAINSGGAIMALWEFLKHLPFGLGVIVIPVNLFIIIISFITNADATLTNIGSMCVRDVPIGTEPPAKVKAVWGISVGIVAIIMAAYGGGVQGVDGVKALAAAAGFIVIFVFVLQIISFIKSFFIDKFIE
ncbi:BCCT family transporter [Treponema primitia]|uniref:BCCT family transporter n=1 Tax=Treponema primitia TaxID=88058 RepID=UPI0002554FA0|nr:BCCT family transporter [Treponema primitia]